MAVSAPAPRIGVFGGAFDPPHNAHVALAAAALAQLNLSELRIFPTGRAWHKTRQLTGADDRLAMSRLAFGDLAGVVVDAREVLRDGPTYTLDTLRELQAENPTARLVLVMGADQATALPSWHGWQVILSIAIISVAHRAMQTGATARFDPASLPGLPTGAQFEGLELPAMDTSATDIRQRVARGEDVSALVPPAVARYIDQHFLYRPA
ncbi:nicotinate (nicotinamide) nucleotide adenylyltransferase [Variovorax sp. PAMC 28711]|uniref:nicotinate (nicotinamide) nucleotide adenylyltransferase n=1 Tax=Variovorax sp. PAMC 28711 TaxID=1795631 RepID=UPI00078E8522|nr:nicotinate (nicotinamide) nucleotide adenylyltransferase [Variovorax sp. PAMC 28711]AMM26256.1 nicotinate-nicotinamide nucleotide adenylyltransferase [Variovorax sp. PAMC 28711]